MYSDDDIQYALETTEVLLEPDRRIDTFGRTSFNFYLISELMDSINEVRVRKGNIHAERPAIISPDYLNKLRFEGFGSQAEDFGEWLERTSGNAAILKYGFNFRRTDIEERLVKQSLEEVRERILRDVKLSNDPLSAVIQGVDDTWEISLLKFTVQMISNSQGINLFDFRRRGLI